MQGQIVYLSAGSIRQFKQKEKKSTLERLINRLERLPSPFPIEIYSVLFKSMDVCDY